MIEQDASHSLIVAATNHPEILDHALFRRFDDILHYVLPDKEKIAQLLQSRLKRHAKPSVDWAALAAEARGLSNAEIVRACNEALKVLVIEEKDSLAVDDIRREVEERIQAKARLGR